jgi:L-ascorbate metabolism protein UlaG (beta-lactamase superfamily)
VTIEAVEAYNIKMFKPSGKPWHPKGCGVGYLIKIEDRTIYHAGDTDFIPEMRLLKYRFRKGGRICQLRPRKQPSL